MCSSFSWDHSKSSKEKKKKKLNSELENPALPISSQEMMYKFLTSLSLRFLIHKIWVTKIVLDETRWHSMLTKEENMLKVEKWM